MGLKLQPESPGWLVESCIAVDGEGLAQGF